MEFFDWWIDDVRVLDYFSVHVCCSTLGLSDDQEVRQTAQAPCGLLLGDPIGPFLHEFRHGGTYVARDDGVFVELIHIGFVKVLVPTWVFEIW